MRFEKGNKGKPKGAKNKVTQSVRASFQLLLEDNIEQMQKDLDKIDNPKDRVQLLLGYAKFVVPQLKAVEVSADVETKFVDWASIEKHLFQ